MNGFSLFFQVHDRSIYLQHLIKSLQKSANISQALLIFSHDYNDEKINKLIRQIDFCKVLQVSSNFDEKAKKKLDRSDEIHESIGSKETK